MISANNTRVITSYAKFNGTHYDFASGEYSPFYPDIKIDQDSNAIAPNKNAILVKGIRTIGMPSKFNTFRMTINMRIRVPRIYLKARGREYDTNIPPFYTWMDKDQNKLLECSPNFKAVKSTDKTTWYYGSSKLQGIKCNIKTSNGLKPFTFTSGAHGVYFVNISIMSDDGRNLRITPSGFNQILIRMNDGDGFYPKDTDLHLFGGINKEHMQEPSPFNYDYELINIHTGYAGERTILNTKRGFQNYRKLKNKPVTALGINGLDAVNCYNKKSASFWNGANFACLGWRSAETDRETVLTKEKNKLTHKTFGSYTCQRHFVLNIRYLFIFLKIIIEENACHVLKIVMYAQNSKHVMFVFQGIV